MEKLQIIAFYLPQFHPFKENDEWWGKGFTEWTNVGKAKPLYKGHNQPRVPTELGYYDLRLPIVREQQADLAKEAGVTAFCYWHYWFGNGKMLMNDIFDEVLNSGSPDFPFCLGWANHSWYAKTWNGDNRSSDKLLIEQTYPGLEDAKQHFNYLIKAFKDPRYVKIDGKPLFYVFAPWDLPIEYIDNFQLWTKEVGFPGLYMVGRIKYNSKISASVAQKYDAMVYERLFEAIKLKEGDTFCSKIIRQSQRMFFKSLSLIRRLPPYYADYSKIYSKLISDEDSKENVIPTIVPQWDHTPRSGWNGTLFGNATPEYFYLHVREVLNVIKKKRNKIAFLKSWNEWGEGNMMEPDLTYGRGFIESLRKAIKDEQENNKNTSNDTNTFADIT